MARTYRGRCLPPPPPWSPRPRDPRFSRATPDKLVERVTKRKAGELFTSGLLSNANWAAAQTANKARKTAITDPARKRMVLWLEAVAELRIDGHRLDERAHLGIAVSREVGALPED
jgi:hypothetical protein